MAYKARQQAAAQANISYAARQQRKREKAKDECAAIRSGFAPRHGPLTAGEREGAASKARKFAKAKGAKSHRMVEVVERRYNPEGKIKATRSRPVLKTMDEKQAAIRDIKKRRAEEKAARSRGVHAFESG